MCQYDMVVVDLVTYWQISVFLLPPKSTYRIEQANQKYARQNMRRIPNSLYR